MRHFKLDGHTPVELRADLIDDLFAFLGWAQWMEESRDDRTVGFTVLPNGHWVSTVFLGIDLRSHVFRDDGSPAIVFECAVFNKEELVDLRRCATWEQAEALHARAIGELNANLSGNATIA